MNTKAIDPKDRNLALAFIGVGYVAVFIGTLCGLLQVLVRSSNITLPSWLNYYQILTAHGILLALIFTTLFIFGFFVVGLSNTMGTFSPFNRRLIWIGYWMMILATALDTALIIANKASVLYTFYAPLKANPWFYVGLAVLVVGSWVSSAGMLIHYFSWKKAHKKQPTPLFGFMSTITLILWIVACLGVAATVLVQMIPWAFGFTDRINVTLSRTLFWYFGHPLVYFWLLPAYMVWYTIVPKLIGGRLFSDTLARFAFILFLLFSIPVGLHHQLVEPGIPSKWKFVQTVLTFAVIVPSLMTAFSMFATFETRGRELGARGLFGWVKKLPWGDVRFTSIFIAMLFFIPGGAGGIVNASYQLNETVHNTLWIVGHFHITVGTPVVMTFFGLTFWLIPYLTGRKFTKTFNKIAFLQIGTWAVGMFFMSTAMHILGLLGAPRRTSYSTYGDHPDALAWASSFFSNYKTMAFGGAILFCSAMLMIGIVIYLWVFAPKAESIEEQLDFPVIERPSYVPRFIESWGMWLAIVAILIGIAYAVPIAELINNAPPGAPGYCTW
ncbi:MAG: b(o/a)3-type cytochrome-c oxidase subunit 1 [Bacillaceae bacterium]